MNIFNVLRVVQNFVFLAEKYSLFPWLSSKFIVIAVSLSSTHFYLSNWPIVLNLPMWHHVLPVVQKKKMHSTIISFSNLQRQDFVSIIDLQFFNLLGIKNERQKLYFPY